MRGSLQLNIRFESPSRSASPHELFSYSKDKSKRVCGTIPLRGHLVKGLTPCHCDVEALRVAEHENCVSRIAST